MLKEELIDPESREEEEEENGEISCRLCLKRLFLFIVSLVCLGLHWHFEHKDISFLCEDCVMGFAPSLDSIYLCQYIDDVEMLYTKERVIAYHRECTKQKPYTDVATFFYIIWAIITIWFIRDGKKKRND